MTKKKEYKNIPRTTKVLLTKLHGGRKIQKKYIQGSAFNESLPNKQNRADKRSNNNDFIKRLIIVVLIFAVFDVFIILYFKNNPGALAEIREYAYFWKDKKSTIPSKPSKYSEIRPSKVIKKKGITITSPQNDPCMIKAHSREVTRQETFDKGKECFPDRADEIYCWKEPSGNIHYSNVGFPNKEGVRKLWIRKM